MLKPHLEEARKRTKSLVKIEDFHIRDDLKTLGIGKTYFVKTYGCQMNVHDSENIKAILEMVGFSETFDMMDADLILLNTCAIRENAHNKVFGMIGRIKHLKEQKPNIIAGICGCMAQEEVVVNEILDKFSFLNFVFGTHNIHELPEILNRAMHQKNIDIEVYSCEGNIIEKMPAKRDNKYKAWVNIMYGCDKFCTYCIVPYTRGKQRSRRFDDIISEVKALKDDGYKEVTLLGQNVNAYGKDLRLEFDMSDLLEAVAKIGIERVRFVTSHPWDFTDKMIDVIAKYPNIMPYIHLPLQSGSDRILKLMGRRYTKKSYLELFDKIKKNIPNVAITTDIIVGFPSESDDDFEDTLDVVRKCKYDSAFTFIFSPREGTPAAKMKDETPLKVKEERLHRLNELVNEYALEANKKYLNKTVKVLLDEVSDKEGCLAGYTETMKLVNVKAPKEMLGKIVDVKITEVKTWSMNGEIA